MLSITDNPFKAISIIYRKAHIWLNNSCSTYSLTAAQAVIILIVCDHKTLTQDDITKRLALDKSVIAKTVTKLVSRGFLIRTTNTKDKRTYDIQPTDQALQVYAFVKEQIDNCFQRMTKNMSKMEKEEFQRLLMIAAETTLSFDD